MTVENISDKNTAKGGILPTTESNRFHNAMQMLAAGHIALTIQSIKMLEPEEQAKATDIVYEKMLENGNIKGFTDFYLKSFGNKLAPSPLQINRLLATLLQCLNRHNVSQHKELIISVYELLQHVGRLSEMIDLAQDLRRLFGEFTPDPTQAQLLTAYHYALQFKNKDLSQKLHDRFGM